MPENNDSLSRRGVIKGIAATASVAALGVEKSGAAAPTPPKKSVPEKLPMGKIGKLEISRLICGGNLINGYSHSRDLRYVSSLMKHYNTEEKVIETFQVCEQNGINAFLGNMTDLSCKMIKKYRDQTKGKMQWIVDGHPPMNDGYKDDVKKAIDSGGAAYYIQGHISETWVRRRKVDMIAKVIDYAKEQGLPAGVGAHKLEVIVECEKAGVKNDFYMKTLHHKNYWSAAHQQECDNVFCRKPEETIEFMKKVKKPWIAFKVMAAGAISPTAGFKYALQNGADFICAGMFDFQVKDDAQIMRGLFARGIKRDREWMA